VASNKLYCEDEVVTYSEVREVSGWILCRKSADAMIMPAIRKVFRDDVHRLA